MRKWDEMLYLMLSFNVLCKVGWENGMKCCTTFHPIFPSNISWDLILKMLGDYFNLSTIFQKWFQRTTLHLYLIFDTTKRKCINFMYTYSFSICYMIELCVYIYDTWIIVCWRLHSLLLRRNRLILATIAQHINMTSMTFNHLCHLSVRANLYK